MALFKIFKGNKVNLPDNKNEGYAYFCEDSHDFFIDHLNPNDDKEVIRSRLSVEFADKLRYQDGETYIEVDPTNILQLASNDEYITKIRTSVGDKAIDYNALANLPDLTEIAQAQAHDKLVTHNKSAQAHAYTLEKKRSSKQLTLSVDGWSNNQQTIALEDFSEDNDVIVTGGEQGYFNNGVKCIEEITTSEYVAADAEEFCPEGSLEALEDLGDFSDTSAQMVKMNNKDYMTVLYNTNGSFNLKSDARLEANTTYTFSCEARLNSKATIELSYLRIYFKLGASSYIIPYTTTPIEFGNASMTGAVTSVDDTTRSTFAIFKSDSSTQNYSWLSHINTSSGWRTFTFEYTPTEADLSRGNQLTIRIIKGPKDAYIQPFDFKNLTLCKKGNNNNLIADLDTSNFIDTSKIQSNIQYDQGVCIRLLNDKNAPRMFYNPNAYLSSNNTYEVNMRIRPVSDTHYPSVHDIALYYGNNRLSGLTSANDRAPIINGELAGWYGIMLNFSGDPLEENNGKSS